ncbi:MAG TPA: hypothetical protein VL307_09455, partial [Chitinophagaceae bacterium]|nr:hypothetical protein [Chitinophagaceae bacterium]
MRLLSIQCSLAALLVATVATAQPAATDTAIMRQLRTAEKKYSQLASIAHQLTDVCGPRLTNSAGYQRAISYVSKTFKEWGLVNDGPEAWGSFGLGWNNNRTYLAMRQPYYQPMIAYPQAWTKSSNGPLNAPVILLNKFDSASIDQLGDAIKGKIVLRKARKMVLANPADATAARYADSALNTLPDTDIMTRAEVEEYAAGVKHDYYTRLYLEAKGAVGLLNSSAASRDGTVFSNGGPAYVKQYKPSLPEMAITRE